MERTFAWCGDFWTLTYADAPETVDYQDFSKFLKRYREWNLRQGNRLPIRYLSVGEYGHKTGRVHFHALIFNGLSPTDKASRIRLWPHGFVYIGTVTPASIRYTARYCLKFGEKGREGVAHWSQRPVLGDAGMRYLAKYMRDRGDKLNTCPTLLTVEGNKYYVNSAMQKVFHSEFFELDEAPPTRPAKAHLDYLLNKRFGDPIEQARKHAESRQQFFNSARFMSGEF